MFKALGIISVIIYRCYMITLDRGSEGQFLKSAYVFQVNYVIYNSLKV